MPSTKPPQYAPPAPAFRGCACGAWVIDGVWCHGTKDAPPFWKPLARPVTPCFGYEHVCKEEV
jgi:hypothetical protein